MSCCKSSSHGFANDNCKQDHVQDKVCVIDSRILDGVTATPKPIYFSNIPVTATGYFKVLQIISPAEDPFVNLIFRLNGTTIYTTADDIRPLESIAFTISDFDEILVALTSGNAPDTVRFELSLTPRYEF